ncbi:HNH endonuclease family protein [Nocardia sp. BMG51109]|uniref:HNH endonuclease family protein n=1 Tax=Nocardia sp. BMG51109 TaxID=1056816 RepID=UPI0004B50E22|nr:HNH endonuclease family protein [Nocardia sp. BMG51109]
MRRFALGACAPAVTAYRSAPRPIARLSAPGLTTCLSPRAPIMCLSALALIMCLSAPGTAHAEPPGIPTADAARGMLGSLTVADEGSMSGYAREKFPHWSTASGKCTTREAVLQRDGTGVEVDAECRPTAGSWHSPYDGKTVTDPSAADIDHVVPLADAWRSGAAEWSDDQRERLANDLEHPQLIAVTAASNRSKGDQDPAQWLPTDTGFRCTYASMWVAVKSAWQLTLQQSEKDALDSVLRGC